MRWSPSIRITARSVSGSSPIKRASKLRPSESVTPSLVAPCTTWLLVKIKPSGVKTNPEPLPRTSAGRRDGDPCRLSAIVPHFDIDYRRADFLRRSGHRSGISVQQAVVVGWPDRLGT